ncbi:RNA-directed DNA polymerase, eukaryota [Tanacetum coccineum]
MVFIMGPQRSKEDDVQRISTSVFITNFPDQSSAKDLWNACKQYGYVVDAFIPNRRSKTGKRFGFVRFIKVFDVECLVSNLCTVWIGKNRIHAKSNIQFSQYGVKRNSLNEDKKDSGQNENSNSYVHAIKGRSHVNREMAEQDTPPPTITAMKIPIIRKGEYDIWSMRMRQYICHTDHNLWDVIVNGDLEEEPAPTGETSAPPAPKTAKQLAAKRNQERVKSILLLAIPDEYLLKFHNVEDAKSLSAIFQASNDFSIDGRVAWVEIEGIPLKVWSRNTSNRIASNNIFETFKLIYRGKVYWVRAKEVSGWSPDFDDQNDEDSESDNEQIADDYKEDIGRSEEELEGENKVNVVPDTKTGENIKDSHTNDSLKFPPGFTPREDEGVDLQTANQRDSFVRKKEVEKIAVNDLNFGSKNNWSKNDDNELVVSGHFKKAESPRTGGSLLNLLDELIKETKMESIELFDIKRCWGNFVFDYVHSDSVGNSGGILCVWDPKSYVKLSATVSDYFVILRGNWVSNGNLLLIISVYAPQDLTEKKLVWDYLGHVIANWKGEVIIIGDFNEVRNKNKRFGSNYNVQGANAFNSFIANAGLEEVPLGGCSFTWCHRSGLKKSKLDRFLISESLLSSCPNISAITLDRYLSDHRPILLRESIHDYGPIPFRFFHYWCEVDGFEKLINEAWYETPGDASNDMLNLMNKLKYLKKKIRAWNDTRQSFKNSKHRLKMELADLEAIIDKDGSKAKIKWAIEGDENSKYYHGILNKKRNQLSIRGVLAAGNWIENPTLVKKEFLNHFKNRFEKPHMVRPIIIMDFPRQLTSIQQTDIEAEVSIKEIKRAVWDYGIDKSLGPDGFTFGFYRRFWKLIEKDMVAAVKHFFQSGSIPKGCNSSFIALIPKIPDAKMVKDFRPISFIGSLYKIIVKIMANCIVMVLGDIVTEVQSAFVTDKQILDGPFILNELLQWCKVKKKQSFIFKVDFEKAYDSVRWDYLDDVLRKFSFGERWCGWIQDCLRSSWGSVIVNGSPTEEFQFYKGLKQGDPLSPFLFILIMKSLHISFQRVVDVGKFKGIEIDSSMQISHMFYADDAVFMGQWSNSNIDTIVNVLKCFHRASGLSINMNKSRIMGIAVNEERVENVASRIGCDVLKVPFSYLGSKVGGLCLVFKLGMILWIIWLLVFQMEIEDLIDRWKINSSQVGFRVNADLSYVKWNNVLTSKEKGGLGVSSLYALNKALMFKWVWRFTTQKNSLWARVVIAIHGEDGKIGTCSKSGHKSIWRDIVQVMDAYKKQGTDLYNFIQKKLGNGANTLFWEDVWCGNMALKQKYPRLYALELDKKVVVADKLA